MLKQFKKQVLFFAVFFLPVLLFAQKNVTGIVRDATTKSPLAGVSVKVSGTNQGTTTDASGNFSLSVTGTPKLIVSSIGYEEQTVSINDQSILEILLKSSSTNLEEVVLTGRRSLPRSSTVTPLPVDNIDVTTLKTTGQTTFDKALQYRVPSFNTINTPVNDATTLLDPYEIRNLGPSRTLILINGKRKNLSSLLYVQFAPGRGETGSDLSAIPTDAIKRVEILRDGASAQYGSDAIAGVMNVILKDRYQYSSLTLNSGITSKGDGANYGLAFNSGTNLAGKGFINYTIDFSQQDNAIRSGIIDRPTEKATFGGDPATDAAIDAFLTKYPTGKNNNGTGQISAAKFNYNRVTIPLKSAGAPTFPQVPPGHRGQDSGCRANGMVAGFPKRTASCLLCGDAPTPVQRRYYEGTCERCR